ncbi:hypothetical protein J6590_089111 [Homalodisca vitripennis]|nr:hypothetical protein J6590_089111 [Homalodisca vitripennis]
MLEMYTLFVGHTAASHAVPLFSSCLTDVIVFTAATLLAELLRFTISPDSRDRLVVRTLRCGRNNPGSNPASLLIYGKKYLLQDAEMTFSLGTHTLMTSNYGKEYLLQDAEMTFSLGTHTLMTSNEKVTASLLSYGKEYLLQDAEMTFSLGTHTLMTSNEKVTASLLSYGKEYLLQDAEMTVSSRSYDEEYLLQEVDMTICWNSHTDVLQVESHSLLPFYYNSSTYQNIFQSVLISIYCTASKMADPPDHFFLGSHLHSQQFGGFVSNVFDGNISKIGVSDDEGDQDTDRTFVSDKEPTVDRDLVQPGCSRMVGWVEYRT